jgi:hypothetical protein
MQTEALIQMLAAGEGPAPRWAIAKRLLPIALLGLLLPAAVSALRWGLIPLEDWADEPGLWVKLAYVLLMAVVALWLVARLARPAAPAQWPMRVLVGVPVVMALGAAAWWLQLEGADQSDALWGSSWRACPWVVFGFSLPALAAGLWALRQMAPTRACAAGAAAGILAGALGASGYALACTETSPAFVAIWYSMGVFATGALGALLGPRVLRW